MTAPCETGKQRESSATDIRLRIIALGKHEGDRDDGYINTNNSKNLPVF
jgi:hypothetical protein